MGEKSIKKIAQSCDGIGGRIRDIRQKAGLTQQELADRMGTSLNTINRIEKSRRTPSAGFIAQLGELLGCDSEWLLTGEESRDRKRTREQIPVLSSLPVDFETRPDLVIGWLSFLDQPEGSYAVRVPDDAMSPFLRSSDFAIFRKGSVANGQVAVLVDRWGEIRIRRLRKTKDQELYVPENPEHQTLQADDDLRVAGQVVRGIRELRI
jgi:transcriptional regulator with XRE-family HTH domain